MANTLLLAQLQSCQQLLNDGQIRDFYTFMLNSGYEYASWARGVAEGDSLAGLSAMDFLTDSAYTGNTLLDI